MNKLSILLIAFSLIAFSCDKEDVSPEDNAENVSFTMTYDGITYTEFDANSLILVAGNIAAKGTEGDGFLLSIFGVGADGTTVNICADSEACNNMCTLMLDFGASVGQEGLVATTGTIKRTGKKLEISASGVTTSLETKSLTATIVVGTVLDF